MAYKNLVAQVCADKNELFCRMRDFICKRNGTYDYSTTGIGWTLIDSSYATNEDNTAINDWYVIYSAGEGTKEDLFFKITYTSGYLKIQGYQSWDTSTHAGANNYNNIDNFYVYETDAKTFWIYGDLDGIFSVNKDGYNGTYYGTTFGKLAPFWDDQTEDIAECSSALTAGSDVSITVDSAPANWAVGTDIFIRTTHTDDMATVKIEKTTIKTISGNTLTADLTNSYTANSKLSDCVGYFCNGSYNFYKGTPVKGLIGDGGSLIYSSIRFSLVIDLTNYDPSHHEDKFVLLDIFYGSNENLGKSKLLKNIPNFVTGFTYEDVLQEDDGTQWRCFNCFYNNYVAVKEV